MSKSHALLKTVRLIHLYIGVFISPALLFFAFTGALQTFSLHETTPNSSYKPPAWAVTLAQIHKKQTITVPQRKPMFKPAEPASADHAPKSSATSAPAPAPALPARAHHPLPLKIFFLFVSVGLFASTLTGLYMTWKYVRNRIVMAVLLLAGIVIPCGLLLI
jgi:hypothetical protein